MHSHAERGNEKSLVPRSHALRGNACSDALRRVLLFSRSHALRGNACSDALRRILGLIRLLISHLTFNDFTLVILTHLRLSGWL